MARNEEKHVTRLNRLILEAEREEYLKKNPIRPKLHTLNKPAEVQKWLPSIKKDIDFQLMQLEVPCYPERVIEGFRQEITRLVKEYNAFVRRLKELDPTNDTVPWTERPYSKLKRQYEEEEQYAPTQGSSITINPVCQEPPAKTPKVVSPPARITLPILQSHHEVICKEEEKKADILYNSDKDLEDKPLNFSTHFVQMNEISRQARLKVMAFRNKQHELLRKNSEASAAKVAECFKLNREQDALCSGTRLGTQQNFNSIDELASEQVSNMKPLPSLEDKKLDNSYNGGALNSIGQDYGSSDESDS